MTPKIARAVLIVAAVGAVAALAVFEGWPTADADAAPQQAEAQDTTAEQELPDFKPTEQLPADSAVAFPTDI